MKVTPAAHYDRLAKWYEVCERAIFRSSLQRCRTAFIDELSGSIVSLGEGDGRFAKACENQDHFWVLETDPAMRAAITRRLPSVKFCRWEELQNIDFFILNFILDCHHDTEIDPILEKVEKASASNGTIIIGEFFPDDVKPAQLQFLCHFLVQVMYLFFRVTCGLKTRKLPAIREILHARGWQCVESRRQWRGFIQSQKWTRPCH